MDESPKPCPNCLNMGHYIASCATGPHPEGTWTSSGTFIEIDEPENLQISPETRMPKPKKDKKFNWFR